MEKRDLCEGGRIVSTSVKLDDNVMKKTFDIGILTENRPFSRKSLCKLANFGSGSFFLGKCY